MNQEIMPAYAAYQKAIDLTLYHAFAELVAVSYTHLDVYKRQELYWQDHREYRQEKESGKETRRKEEAGTKAGAGKETFC